MKQHSLFFQKMNFSPVSTTNTHPTPPPIHTQQRLHRRKKTIKSNFKMARRNRLAFLPDFAMILSVLQVRSVSVRYGGI